jgi:hypothetical protein
MLKLKAGDPENEVLLDVDRLEQVNSSLRTFI